MMNGITTGMVVTLCACAAADSPADVEAPGAPPAGAVGSITITPAVDTILAWHGQAVQLQATVRDAQGNTVANAPVTWTTGFPQIGSVTSTGLYTSLEPRTNVVFARAGSISQKVYVRSAVMPAMIEFRNLNWLQLDSVYDFMVTMEFFNPPRPIVDNWPDPRQVEITVSPELAVIGRSGVSHGRLKGVREGIGVLRVRVGNAVVDSVALPVLPHQWKLASVVTGGSNERLAPVPQMHTCGLTPAGLAFCWGTNNLRQVGVSTLSTAEPRLIYTPLEFTSLSAGPIYTCGITADQHVYCWGGRGNASDYAANRIFPGVRIKALSGSHGHLCGLGEDGKAHCTDFVNPVGLKSAPTPFVSIHTGPWHACGLTSDGAAYCWGSNRVRQLGDGTTIDRLQPVRAAGSLTFTKLAVDAQGDPNSMTGASCGLTASGRYYCWGNGADVTDRGAWYAPNQAFAPFVRPGTYPVGVARPQFRELEAHAMGGCGRTLDNLLVCYTRDGYFNVAEFVERKQPLR